MEKNQSTMSTSEPTPSAPPTSPSALPPSYEEAIAQSMAMTNPSINVGPYPKGGSSTTAPLSTTPYAQPGVHMPVNPLEVPDYESQYAGPPPYPITTESRVVRNPRSTSYVLAPGPVKMQCPSCMADIKTSTVSDHSPLAHACCLILCVLGCCLCSCLPYCMSAFMSVHHFCPRCKIYIGTWKGFDTSRRLMAVRV